METIEQRKWRELVEDLIDARDKKPEIPNEFLGADILSSARISGVYETPSQYCRNKQGGEK